MTAQISAEAFMSASPAAINGSSPWASLTLPSGHITVFDAEDLPLVEQFKWHALKGRRTYYVQTKGNAGNGRRRTYLHRLLMREPEGMEVDHWNHDGLDNRRSNLRVATTSQNNGNAAARTGYRGVWVAPNNKTNPWRARLGKHHIGYFPTAWEAAQAYNTAALAYWGEFALLNEEGAL